MRATDEPLRIIAHWMAETELTHSPIVERGPHRRLLGMISLEDLLKARALNLEAERRREHVMQVRESRFLSHLATHPQARPIHDREGVNDGGPFAPSTG